MSTSYDEVMVSLGLEPSTPRAERGRVEHEHGDHRRYVQGCRCGECREAFRIYHVAWRAKQRSKPSGADRAGHGKPSTYRNYGCRCDECRAANSADVAAYRARRRERAAKGGEGR
ncbi:hypothetical protein G3M58_10650 [Streptomyces sp. SID7499]|uniref:Uncharacterized protein n=1 Tax=Streptomyces sp. SID7499 TaxID=2706086 RepID=A0A6G3WN68_9ACTN|nr:hypothetical protein [Streptomyces sp. SID7499]